MAKIVNTSSRETRNLVNYIKSIFAIGELIHYGCLARDVGSDCLKK